MNDPLFDHVAALARRATRPDEAHHRTDGSCPAGEARRAAPRAVPRRKSASRAVESTLDAQSPTGPPPRT
ncbi:hypothetical protein ACFV3R_09410 [Streptomyces sp. NPDC059740]|uniref:hypothetical protein n=1 Tax=Streptomyces sp. NPDC059740 TaxID=3346926 RepID=UPI003668AB6E